MKIPDPLEIELYPIQTTESEIELQSSFSKEIRGSNFKQQATIFIDKQQTFWLWKKLRLNSLVKEYIASYLASELGIRIPRSIIARKGYSIGLIQEWIEDAKGLPSYLNNIPKTINKTELIDLLVFEAWIGALDRHGGNYLASRKGNLWAIDFEYSFSNHIHGSELCLYYPWIKDSKHEIRKSIEKLLNQITEKQLLEKKGNFLNLGEFVRDPRAIEALKRQILQIFTLLKENLAKLDELVELYMDKSCSRSELSISSC